MSGGICRPEAELCELSGRTGPSRWSTGRGGAAKAAEDRAETASRCGWDALCYAHGSMWIWGADRVWRVSGSGETSATPIARHSHPVGGSVPAAATDRWVFFGHGRQLLQIDPRTGSVTDESRRLRAALNSARISPPVCSPR